MSKRPLAPQRGSFLSHDMQSLQGTVPMRNRKASFACLACKQRKSKVQIPTARSPPALLVIDLLTYVQCCQSTPCKLCQIHGSQCQYDETADQRRRVSKQRLLDEYQKQRLLLLGIIATIRTQSSVEIQRLVDLIQSQVSLPQLSSYVERMLATSPELSEACRRLSLGEDDLQGQTTAAAVSEDHAQLTQEPERTPGLPMNAQITLDVHP